jgi:hypothetical protein
MTTSQGQRKSYSTSVRFAALLLAFAGSTAAAPAYSASPRVSISGDSRSLNAILLDAIAALASLEPESGTPPEWLSTVGKLRRITDDAAVAVLAAYRVRGLTASEAMLASLALEMAVRRLASGAEAGTRLNGMLTRSDRAALTAAAEAGRAVSRTRWLAAVERDRAAAAAAALVHGLITAQDLVAGRAPAGARARSRSAALDSLAIAADTFKQIGEPRAAARAVLLSAAFTVSTWGEADLRELQEADTPNRRGLLAWFRRRSAGLGRFTSRCDWGIQSRPSD